MNEESEINSCDLIKKTVSTQSVWYEMSDVNFPWF